MCELREYLGMPNELDLNKIAQEALKRLQGSRERSVWNGKQKLFTGHVCLHDGHEVVVTAVDHPMVSVKRSDDSKLFIVHGCELTAIEPVDEGDELPESLREFLKSMQADGVEVHVMKVNLDKKDIH